MEEEKDAAERCREIIAEGLLYLSALLLVYILTH